MVSAPTTCDEPGLARGLHDLCIAADKELQTTVGADTRHRLVRRGVQVARPEPLTFFGSRILMSPLPPGSPFRAWRGRCPMVNHALTSLPLRWRNALRGGRFRRP